jgi:hypothetical protein
MDEVKSVSKKFKKPVYIVDTSNNQIISNDTVFSINGYDFGDRLLEGVMFRAKLSEDGKELTVIGTSDNKYMSDLNSEKWMKVALKLFTQIANEGDFVFSEKSHKSSDLILATEEIMQEHYPELIK